MAVNQFTVQALAGNPLEINWLNILFHIINLAILITALYFLLFKPVKKFMEKRRSEMIRITDENERMKKEVDQVKAEYDGLIQEAKQEAVRAGEEAKRMASARAEEIVQSANREAQEIRTRAKADMDAERQRLENDIKKQVAVVGIEVAKKVLEREITPKDDSDIIDNCLKEWSEQHEKNN